MKNSILFLLLIALSHWNCQNSYAIKYSFFVAGHAYGSPQLPAEVLGLHPPFLEKIGWLNQTDSLKFGIFTGDIARLPKPPVWDKIEEQLQSLKVKTYIAPGNHDNSTSKLYQERIGDNYFSFEREKDLFIILDGNLNNWNIEEKQFDFLAKKIAEADQYRHIFIFVHQLIWWQKKGKWATCQPNSFQGKADTLTFHKNLLPLLQQIDNQIFIFAGDAGAVPKSAAICGLKHKNITFISSGMGIDQKDNIILTEIDEDGKINLRLIGLKCQSGVNCLGTIDDYLQEI